MSTKKLDSAQIAKLVADAGKSVSIADADLRKLLERIADILPPLDGAEEEKPPAQKKQYVVLVSDPQRTLPDDFAPCCWVLQIPDDEAPQAVESFIVAAAEAFNATKRGRMLPVQTIGEACESIPAKLAKEYKLWVKTKSPTYALVTRNELPNTDSLLDDDNRGGPKDIDPKRKEALGGFVKLCRDSGATMEIRTAGGAVKIDGNGITAAKIGGAA